MSLPERFVEDDSRREETLHEHIDRLMSCIRTMTKQCATLIHERDELQKKVWRYEKNGVTCQTYGHVVGACAECNTHEEAQR